jgi:mono/diheme cytochrome c family protein
VRRLAIALVCALTGAAAGVARAADVEAGQHVFVEQCSLCHATNDTVLFGPGLQGVMKRKALVSTGKPPTPANVKSLILEGQGRMPRIPLDDAQLDLLIAYLKTL